MGLLQGAFRPEPDVRAVRTLMRNRSDLVEMASQHVQHMQKALKQMNVQFQHVISDITGLTGLAILDAIVNGERDPAELAKLRDPHVKASEDPLRTLFPDSGSVCPDNDISGGKVLWRGNRRVKNRAGTLFRLAAHSLHHNQTPMGDYLRRMKAKLGPAAATTATAHKIAIIFYTMVNNQVK